MKSNAVTIAAAVERKKCEWKLATLRNNGAMAGKDSIDGDERHRVSFSVTSYLFGIMLILVGGPDEKA